MATDTIASFADLAARLATACRPAAAPDPAVLAEMASVAEDHARHFTHPGRARDDAVALFWQVAPLAFADPAALAAADRDPDLTAAGMAAAIRASPLGRDFAAAALPDAFFRAVVRAMLQVMRDRAAPSPPSSPSPSKAGGFHTG